MRINETIIGINPGTRYLGLAVIKNSELVDWRVKAFLEKWSDKKLKKILTSLYLFILNHSITVIALKKLDTSRSSKALDEMVKKIGEIAKRRRIKIYHYSIDEIKNCFANAENMKKIGVAKMVAESNKELQHELDKEIQNKNVYHMKMFEAVALSLLCEKKLEQRGRNDLQAIN